MLNFYIILIMESRQS